MQLTPWDAHNQELVAQAHPQDWKNPAPRGRYHLVAIGGGTAGIIAALGAAGLGGRAALVERHLLGGDCLNYGCVPSKALLAAARAAYAVRDATRFGLQLQHVPPPDFAAVMQRLRELRARVSHHDSAARFAGMGVDVFLGDARFTGPDSLQVGDLTLRFHRAVIATGARPVVPDIPGLKEAGCLTNETVFSLASLPKRLAVIGAGPVGCELAQAFRRLGSEVHLINRQDRLLAKEDAEAAEVVQRQFADEGISLRLGWQVQRASELGDAKRLVLARGEDREELLVDEILVGAGRQANVEGLGLETAGVTYSAAGVAVDDFLRTGNPSIYAAGDVCSRFQFTHAADAMARIAIQNSLFLGRQRVSRLVIPRCTYTDPEVAHVGLTPAEAAERGVRIVTHRVEMSQVDRALLDDDERGFAAVHVGRRGRIVGATLIGPHAGESIGEITLLMTQGLGLGALAKTIHCYPTQVEALKRAADAYNRTRLTPLVARLFRAWLGLKRS